VAVEVVEGCQDDAGGHHGNGQHPQATPCTAAAHVAPIRHGCVLPAARAMQCIPES
jgi:hypothetical protein